VRDVAWYDLPVSDIEPDLPLLIAEAREDLRPADNSDAIVEGMISLAELKGVNMPKGPAFEISLEIMAGWPPDLFVMAYKQIIEHHAYPRLPCVAEFRAFIQEELDQRHAVVDGLEKWHRNVQMRDRNAAVKREAEWMERGRVRPTQAELDAVAAIKQQVHRHLTTPPSAPAAAGPPPPADPRCDHASPDQPPPPAQSGTP
jgi:hypothetical protein